MSPSELKKKIYQTLLNRDFEIMIRLFSFYSMIYDFIILKKNKFVVNFEGSRHASCLSD